MKKITSIKRMIFFFLFVSGMVFAGDMDQKNAELQIPHIKKSLSGVLNSFNKGKLTQEEIDDVLLWARSCKFRLQALRNARDEMPLDEYEEYLIDGINGIISDSGERHNEFLMRRVLKRAMEVHKIMNEEILNLEDTTNSKGKSIKVSHVGVIDVKVRFLMSSTVLAEKYYEHDLDFLINDKDFESTSFADFGLCYYDFLSKQLETIFDASANYKVSRAALEYLLIDLVQDLENKKYALPIVEIYHSLPMFPIKASKSDYRLLNLVKRMKRLFHRLNL